jgi:hypothetical protein
VRAVELAESNVSAVIITAAITKENLFASLMFLPVDASLNFFLTPGLRQTH